MAGRIPRQFIDELTARVDIVDLIDERVPLKKQGRDFVARCPFHDEKTPSFSVSREKQFYYCFGCGAHGTALGFLMDYVRLGFVEAVEDLADRLGLEVPREADPGDALPDPKPVLEMLGRANDFYRRQLRRRPEADPAVSYLRDRGTTGETAAEFQLGYAPDGWNNLLSALGRSAGERELLERAGLAARRETGGEYDRFRDRIMFPIHDRRGRIIGFGGRALGDGTPKYLNSPETDVFHKGQELYGLYQAQRANRNLTRLIVVEGYMDVLALAQFEFRDAVATLGTAVTREHIGRLFRAAPSVTFCFDGDRAGRTAAWRALETALPLMRDGFHASFVFMPEGEDPDSFLQSRGRAAFSTELERATPLSRFLFEHLLAEVDPDTLEGKSALFERARGLISRLPRGAFRELLTGRLAELTQMRPEKLSRLMHEETKPSVPGSKRPRRTVRTAPSLVRKAIHLLLHDPRLGQGIEEIEGLQRLEMPGTPILIELLELSARDPDLTTGRILEHFRDRDAGRHLAKLAVEPPLLTEGLGAEFTATLEKLEQSMRDQRYGLLARKLRLEPLTDEERAEYLRLAARGPVEPDEGH